MKENTKDSIPQEAALPEDGGAEAFSSPTGHHPLHLHPGYVGLVILGGVFGAPARYTLEHALPAPAGWPLPTLLINLVGAFALGALLEGLSRRGADGGSRRILRLLVGTGFLGAFTTYSTLALEATLLMNNGRVTAALLYLLTSLVGGTCAATAGIWVAARQHRTVTARSQRRPQGSRNGGVQP